MSGHVGTGQKGQDRMCLGPDGTGQVWMGLGELGWIEMDQVHTGSGKVRTGRSR